MHPACLPAIASPLVGHGLTLAVDHNVWGLHIPEGRR
jgi:hypothetical protein